MLVRSPTLTNRRVVGDGERLEARQPQWPARSPAASRGGLPSTASAIAAMCAGVVPQQPPTRLTRPASANSRDDRRRSRRATRRTRRRRWAGRRSGSRRRRCRRSAPARRCRAASPGAPSAQLRPTASGCACRTEFQNASVTWPDSVRPEASVMVPEIDHRPAAAALLEQRLDGEDRRLGVERVEDRLDEEEVGAAVDQAVGLLEVGRDQLVEGDVAGAGVVDVRARSTRSGWSGRARRRRSAACPGSLGHRVARLAGQPRRRRRSARRRAPAMP